MFLTTIGFTIYFWNSIELPKDNESNSTLVQMLDYFTPDMFNGLIYVVVNNPVIVGVAFGISVIYSFIRKYSHEKLVEIGESLRHIILDKRAK